MESGGDQGAADAGRSKEENKPGCLTWLVAGPLVALTIMIVVVSFVAAIGYSLLPLYCQHDRCADDWVVGAVPFVIVPYYVDSAIFVIMLTLFHWLSVVLRKNFSVRIFVGAPLAAFCMATLAGVFSTLPFLLPWTHDRSLDSKTLAEAMPVFRQTVLFVCDQIFAAFAGDALGVFFSGYSDTKVPNDDMSVNLFALFIRLTSALALSGGLISILFGLTPSSDTDEAEDSE